MLEDYSNVIVGVAVAAIVCIILYFVIRRLQTPSKSENFVPKQIRESSRSLSASKESISSVQPAQLLPEDSSRNPELIIKLRQNLRVKVMHDEAKIDRLIDFERKYNPNGSETELMQAVVDRWEHDNR